MRPVSSVVPPFSGRRHLCWRLLLLLPLAAWSADKNALRIACFDFPRTYNPVYATSETAQAVANKIYQSLFCFNQRGEIRPELVDSFSCSASGLEISFVLRKGARFSDGSALDSRDVAATVALLKNPDFAYPYLSDLDFIDKIDVVDPLRLHLRLKRRFAPWKNYLTFKILSAGEIKGFAAGEFRRLSPLGSGPYRLAAVNEPWRLELEKNPFWPSRLRYARIIYSILGEPRQAPLKLLNSEIDATEIQGDDARAYDGVKSWRQRFNLLRYKKFGFTYLVFNMRQRGISRNLRRIFYNRLQTSRFLDDFLEQSGERVFSPFLLFGNEKRPHPFPFTPPSACRKLKIMTNGESAARRQFVLFLCAEMKKCGVELEPVFCEYQMFLQRLKRGEFDLAVSAFLLDIDWNMKDILSSGGYFNYAGYADARMDAVLDEGLLEMNDERRRQIYSRAHDLWLESLPLIPLFNLNYYVGIARNVKIPAKRFELVGSCGDFFYNIEEW
jgi:peptide/nickel transport system substrate-binding protein